MAATLNSISTHDNNLYSEIEPHLVPVLVRIVGSRGGDLVEYFENAIEVLTYFTYSSNIPFSRSLWGLFELLIDAFHEWAYDYIQELVRPFDNFVTRDTGTFLAGVAADGRRYVDKLTGVASRLLAPDNLYRTCERDAVKATNILLSVVHNCKGRIDETVAQYARLVLTVVPVCLGPRPVDPQMDDLGAPAAGAHPENNGKPWMPSLASALVMVWSSLLWYDAGLALKTATSAGSPDAFFAAWLRITGEPARLSALAIKCAILGFAAILCLDDPSFAVLKPHALARVVALVGNDEPDPNEENAAQRGDDDDRRDDDVEEEDDDDVEGAAFDEDVNDPDDEAYMAALASAKDENGTMRDALASLAYVTDLEMDDDDDVYESPIDNEDELVHLFSAFKLAQARGELDVLVAQLPELFRERIPDILAFSERRAREQAQAQQQQPQTNQRGPS